MKELVEPIFLIGLPGSGKSTIAKYFSKKHNLGFIDTDEEILKMVNHDFPEINTLLKMYAEIENSTFREYEYKVLIKVAELANIIGAIGGGFVTFEKSKNLVNTFSNVVFLECNIEELYQRIVKMPERPMFKDTSIIDKLIILENDRKEKYLNIAKYKLNGDRIIQEIVLSLEIIARDFV